MATRDLFLTYLEMASKVWQYTKRRFFAVKMAEVMKEENNMIVQKVQETVDYIESRTNLRPETAIVLGSGLGKLADVIGDAVYCDYNDLPHFKKGLAPGHRGRLVLGYLGEKAVMCMQGRLHFYEGHTLEDVTYPIRVMAHFGIKNVILSNAAGGINKAFSVGDLMLITDHINFMGHNPLIGTNEAEFGPRFPDMTYAYDRHLAKLARETAKDLDIPLQEGVYLACAGPSYETPAEIRAFRLLGADAVGMSTVPEVIVANHSGMNVLAMSCISNMAAGILEKRLTEEEVLAAGEQVSTKFGQLVTAIVQKL